MRLRCAVLDLALAIIAKPLADQMGKVAVRGGIIASRHRPPSQLTAQIGRRQILLERPPHVFFGG